MIFLQRLDCINGEFWNQNSTPIVRKPHNALSIFSELAHLQLNVKIYCKVSPQWQSMQRLLKIIFTRGTRMVFVVFVLWQSWTGLFENQGTIDFSKISMKRSQPCSLKLILSFDALSKNLTRLRTSTTTCSSIQNRYNNWIHLLRAKSIFMWMEVISKKEETLVGSSHKDT